jgi:hypothetical protein
VFIGFANYYRRFIRNFSRIAAPLNAITERGSGQAKGGHKQRQEESKTIVLTKAARYAFAELRRAFLSAPILKHFDPLRPIRVETNASGYAIGGVMLQQHEFGGKM